MKLLLVLMVCAVAAAAPKVKQVEPLSLDLLQNDTPESHNILVNTLVRQLITYLRHIINNGSALFDIPKLDPLLLDHFHLVIPAGLINLDLELKDIRMDGLGSFVDHTANLNLRDMTFDLDISVPVIDIRAGSYDMVGDLFTAVPLYGKGEARFYVEGFRFQAKLHLTQSADGKSVLIDRVANPSFTIPFLKKKESRNEQVGRLVSELTGAIGGGDIDAIVNAMIEDVVMDYINRFQGAISLLSATVVKTVLNPVLDQLDTWKYIAPLIPRN